MENRGVRWAVCAAVMSVAFGGFASASPMRFPQGSAAVPLKTARQQFRQYLRETPGASRDHRANLLAAAGAQVKSAAMASAIGAVGGTFMGGQASNFERAHAAAAGAAIGVAFGLTAWLPTSARNFVRDARAETVEAGVKAKALSPATVESWAKSGLTQTATEHVTPASWQEREAAKR